MMPENWWGRERFRFVSFSCPVSIPLLAPSFSHSLFFFVGIGIVCVLLLAHVCGRCWLRCAVMRTGSTCSARSLWVHGAPRTTQCHSCSTSSSQQTSQTRLPRYRRRLATFNQCPPHTHTNTNPHPIGGRTAVHLCMCAHACLCA
jgi:hypothetical protein